MSSLAKEIQANGFARVEGITKRDEADRYLLEVSKGETLQINALAKKVPEDIFLRLGYADGEVIARSDDYLWSSSSRITWTAANTETVEIVVKVDDVDFGENGVEYNLYIDNLSVDDEFDRPGEGDDAFDSDGEALRRAGKLLKRFAGDNEVLDIDEMSALILSFVNQDRVVSANDFEVLQGISIKLENFVDPLYRDYYQYIYNSVVGDNAANQWWTGGQSQRVALGNLQIGTSRRHLDRLVKKWLGGQDSPNTLVVGDEAQGINQIQKFEYGTTGGPIFEGISTYDQVAQGVAATCYFLAGLMDIANRHQDIFNDLFLDNGNDTYGVRFYGKDGKPVWVTVDPSSLPITRVNGEDGLAFSGSDSTSGLDSNWNFRDPITNILWSGMLEKAFAQANEIGVFARADQSNSYRAIEYGDAAVFRYLGGEKFKMPYLGITRNPNQDEITGNSFVLFENADFIKRKPGPGESDAILLKALQNAEPLIGQPSSELSRRYQEGDAMLILSRFEDSDQGKKRFANEHAFAVVNYSSDTGVFTIANPWGKFPGSLSSFQLSSSDLDELVYKGSIVPVFAEYSVG